MVENEEQLDKYLAVEEQLPKIHTVVVLDSTGLADLDHPKVVMLEQFYRLGDEGDEDLESEWNRRIDSAEPNDTAILVYTSGTTGAPKGAMISNRNLIFISRPFMSFTQSQQKMNRLFTCRCVTLLSDFYRCSLSLIHISEPTRRYAIS